ncbi:MAG: alpha/beta hydrolase [Melioribacteraceae bacterium]|nr:alpha/beta hydrolase [Melioribacteraceae bacterium]
MKTLGNDVLSITTYGNDAIETRNCLIYIHGFKGFKDWGFGPYLGKYFSENNFFVITFNFSHNGIGCNSSEFTEFEKFAGNTYSLELEELNQVIKAYKNNFFGEISESNKIGLIGHSRGGGIALLTAGSNKDVDAVTTWSSIAKFDRFTKRQKKEWKEKGFLEILNARTKQIMKLGLPLLNDIEENIDGKLNLSESLKNLKKPLLFVQGEQDLAVTMKEAENLYKWSDKNYSTFISIPKAGHTFDITHPFTGSNDKFDRVLKETREFFINNFS